MFEYRRGPDGKLEMMTQKTGETIAKYADKIKERAP